jgi:hypothetical protein
MKEHCNIAAIPLTQNQIAIVDIWNYEWLNQWKWYAHNNNIKHRKTFYAVRSTPRDQNRKQTTIKMHRQIMDFPEGLQVDHIDGNTLINLEGNLKNVTHRQNQQNRHHPKTSKYPGVNWDKRSQKWRSRIEINGERFTLGFYDSEEDAYEEYREKCKEGDQMHT